MSRKDLHTIKGGPDLTDKQIKLCWTKTHLAVASTIIDSHRTMKVQYMDHSWAGCVSQRLGRVPATFARPTC